MNLVKHSGSRSELARHCTYWMRGDVAWTDGDSPEASKGREIHAAAARYVSGEVIEPFEDPELRMMFGRLRDWLERASRGLIGMRPELAIAYDPAADTARVLEDPPGEDARWYAVPELRAKYGVKEGEIPMRLDLLCRGVDQHGAFVRYVEYKCHFGPDHVDAEAQAQTGALFAARAFGVTRAKATVVHVWADREVLEEPYELEEFELDAEAFELAKLASAPAAADANEGPWCEERHCGARAACKATAEYAESAVALLPAEQLVRVRNLEKPIASDADAAEKLVAMKLFKAYAEERLEAYEREVKAWADARGGFPVGKGQVYAGKPQVSATPDLMAPGALEVLEELELDFAIEQKTSWTAIEAVSDAKTAKVARERLEAIGAVKTSSSVVYKARKP